MKLNYRIISVNSKLLISMLLFLNGKWYDLSTALIIVILFLKNHLPFHFYTLCRLQRFWKEIEWLWILYKNKMVGRKESHLKTWKLYPFQYKTCFVFIVQSDVSCYYYFLAVVVMVVVVVVVVGYLLTV